MFIAWIYLTCFKKPAKNKAKIATELICSVCGGVVGEMYKCILCKKFAHMFCGKDKDEEEFVQTASCFICLKKKGMQIFIIMIFYYI